MSTAIKKTRKSRKYVFTLNNVNTEKVENKYGITLTSNISVVDNPPINSTKLTELTDMNNDGSTLDVISFLDETKRLYQCNISMIDFRSGKETRDLKYHCYWDRHPFDSDPIGCPIRYVSNKAIKNYYSEISKDYYTIKENITKKQNTILNSQSNFVFIPIQTSRNSVVKTIEKEYYETDGIFCSFPCCKAYINEFKGSNKLYEHSSFLLCKLYYDMYEIKNVNINPAPHWRQLREYGGDMSITQFRETFSKSKFQPRGIIRNTDLFKPIATLFEEKLSLSF